LHKELEQSLQQASQSGKAGEGLAQRATIVPFGVQDYEHLPSEGITEESMDTVVLVQVLCSIENPKSHIGALIRYLKPGGKLIMVSAYYLPTVSCVAHLTMPSLLRPV
jgi:2-polyprenyl-3-methyl-5-hydroxy-6-metoxy-1,4-benzoquinol methylase